MFAEVPLYPESASTFAAEVDAMTFWLTGLSVFFTLLIAGLIASFAMRYRRRSEAECPRPVKSSSALEVTWTLIPLVLALFTFFWGARVFFSWGRPPDDAMEVFVVGRQWMWHVQHVGGQREINTIHVPVNRPVKVTLTSQDVIHSFFVPEFRIHRDAVPGRYLHAWFQATKPGRYHLFCSQYCGTNHSRMIGEVVVMEQEDFQTWLNQKVDGSMAMEGRKLFLKLQCVACHSADAHAKAPVLEGLYRTQVELQDGRTVLADDDYLRESILNPPAKVVRGFQPIMPSFQDQVDEMEILQLLAFIKSLGPGQTPPRVERAEPPRIDPTLQKKKDQRP
jgi:cytochrome c oxidase subunit 2